MTNNLDKFVEEYNYLKKCESLLNEVYTYLSPYDHAINKQDCGDLPRRIAELLIDFNDNE